VSIFNVSYKYVVAAKRC